MVGEYRGEVGIEGVECQLLLVSFRGIDRKSCGGRQHTGIRC
jgi:hypothetical protein